MAKKKRTSKPRKASKKRKPSRRPAASHSQPVMAKKKTRRATSKKRSAPRRSGGGRRSGLMDFVMGALALGVGYIGSELLVSKIAPTATGTKKALYTGGAGAALAMFMPNLRMVALGMGANAVTQVGRDVLKIGAGSGSVNGLSAADQALIDRMASDAGMVNGFDQGDMVNGMGDEGMVNGLDDAWEDLN